MSLRAALTVSVLQETRFILQNASWFRTQAENVYQVLSNTCGTVTAAVHCNHLMFVLQVIDTEALTLQNIITFPPDGAFVVQSTIDLLDNQRVQFEFTGASLILPRRELTLPPYGKGW